MKRLAFACAMLTATACSPKESGSSGQAAAPAPAPAATPIVAVKTDLPAGTYKLDPAHASLIFRVNHMGMSHYTARFTRFDAELQLDPANPAASSVTATIDPRSLKTDNRDKTYNFDAELQGDMFLDAAKFPQMTFRSTKVELTGPRTARITGELGLHGVTRPVTLDATFNDGYAKMSLDPMGSRIGFSARGGLKRSEFGVGYGVPQPGSKMGVSDEVEVVIEAEFTRPVPKAG